MDKLQLLILAQQQDCECFEEEDLTQTKPDINQQYKDFYDDVKQQSNYIKEDW